MFSFLRKQKKDDKNDLKKNLNGKDNKEREKSDMEERIEKEIAIHTMPEKFRLNSMKVNKAKTTGIFVMVGGFIFILVIAIVLYFFIFKAPDEKEALPSPEDKSYSSESEDKSTPSPKESQGEEEQEEITEEIKEVLPIATLEDYLDDLAQTATSTAEEGATSTPAEIATLGDNDGDGLTGREEMLLGCDDEKTDSDGDGYLDYEEMMNLYNPAGAGEIIDNSGIGKYENKTFAYNILYPLNWPRTAIGGNDSIMFKSEDNHFIQVIAQPNVEKQSIENWYGEQFKDETIDSAQRINGKNWQGIKSEDGLVVYLTDSSRDYIFVLSYNTGPDGVLSYKNIFAMMVKSLEIGE